MEEGLSPTTPTATNSDADRRIAQGTASAPKVLVLLCALALIVSHQEYHSSMATISLYHPYDSDNVHERRVSTESKSVDDIVRGIVYIAQRSEQDLERYDYLDMAFAASRLIVPNLDESSIRFQIEIMAKEAQTAWSSQKSLREKVTALNRVIFERHRFATPPHDAPIISGQRVFDTYSLPGVLKGRKGFCEGLSTVYFLVAKQAELPVSIVNLPIHTLLQVRISGKGCTGKNCEQLVYVESIQSGKKKPASVVRSMNGAKDAAATSGVYLSPLSKKQFLSLHVNALAYGLMQQAGDPSPLTMDQMVRLADAIKRLDPKRPESLDTAALIYHRAGYYDEAIATIERALKLSRKYGAPKWVRAHYRKMKKKYLSRETGD